MPPPKKKKVKRLAKTNSSAYYYVVEITRPGGLSHAVTTREDEAKGIARATARDGNPAEIFRINLTDREKRIAFLKTVVKDPNATWKKIARPITFRPNEAVQPTEKPNDRTNTDSRTTSRRVPGSRPERSPGKPKGASDADTGEDADTFFERAALGTSQEENAEDESRDGGGESGWV